MRLLVLADGPPSEYTDVDGITWRRTGYCCRCSDCCKGNPFDGPDMEYCPLFTVGVGGGRCSDRGHPYYLAGCNVWPQVPIQIADKPRCTYRFERVI